MKNSLFFLFFILASCTSVPHIEIHGNTIAQNSLRDEIFKTLPSYAAIISGCRKPITKIETEILEMPDLKRDEKGELISEGLVFKERWNLYMCEQIVPVYLTVWWPEPEQSMYQLAPRP